MSDTKGIGGPKPTTTTAKTTKAEEAKAKETQKAPDPDADAVGIGDFAAAVGKEMIKDVLDPFHIARGSKAVYDTLTGVDGSTIDKVKNLVDIHRAVDSLKPGEDLTVGRKLEIGVDGVAGETETEISVKREPDGYEVTFEISGAAGGEINDLGEGAAKTLAGTKAVVTYKVKTAEEAKALLDKGVVAIAAGVVVPGADGAVALGTAIGDREHIKSTTVALDAKLAVEVGGKDLPTAALAEAGVKLETEATASYGATFEPGPPRVVYVEASFEAEVEGGLEGSDSGGEAAMKNTGGKAKATIRYAVSVGDDFDPKSLSTAEGQKAIVEKAKASNDVTLTLEAEVHGKGHVISGERTGTGKSIGEAVASYRDAKADYEVHRETSSKVGGGIKSLGGGELGLELAYDKRENVSASDKKKILGG